jgi:hypothetical protein
MAQIVKLIWRLDYPVSYAYLDSRGTALNILSNTVENFWDVLGDGQANMSFLARTNKDDRFRTLSIEPTIISGAIEWGSGIELDRALQDASFRGVDRIVRELLKLFEVKALLRAGVRVMCTEKFADGRRPSRERFLNLIDGELRKKAEVAVGPIQDLGIIFEGQSIDHVSYRATFGPYDKKNVEQILEKKPSDTEYEMLGASDLFFDIDLFETNFSFAEHSLFRWATTKVAKAVDFIAMCSGKPPRVMESGDGSSSAHQNKR